MDILDRRKSIGPKIVNPDEKLLDCAKNDRRFRTPAIGIRMLITLFAKQHSALAQERNDVRIRLENIFSGKLWPTGFSGEPAMIVHR